VEPHDIHQRVPFIVGSREEIDLFTILAAEDS